MRSVMFPPSFEAWAASSGRCDPSTRRVECRPKPLLIVHGDDDESVPTVDPCLLAEAHGAAELRIVAERVTAFVTIPAWWPSSSAGSIASATG